MGHYARLEAGATACARGRCTARRIRATCRAAPSRSCAGRGFRWADDEEGRVDHAWGLDFGMATKKESQEICFVPVGIMRGGSRAGGAGRGAYCDGGRGGRHAPGPDALYGGAAALLG